MPKTASTARKWKVAAPEEVATTEAASPGPASVPAAAAPAATLEIAATPDTIAKPAFANRPAPNAAADAAANASTEKEAELVEKTELYENSSFFSVDISEREMIVSQKQMIRKEMTFKYEQLLTHQARADRRAADQRMNVFMTLLKDQQTAQLDAGMSEDDYAQFLLRQADEFRQFLNQEDARALLAFRRRAEAYRGFLESIRSACEEDIDTILEEKIAFLLNSIKAPATAEMPPQRRGVQGRSDIPTLGTHPATVPAKPSILSRLFGCRRKNGKPGCFS